MDLQVPALVAVLATLPECRPARGRRHSLLATLTAACAAVLCGNSSQSGIADWIADCPPPSAPASA